MNLKKFTGLVSTGMLLFLAGCEKYVNPLDTEQYEKNVYLVGANQSNNEGVQIVDLRYKASADDTASTYISVAVGGSRTIDRDLTVQLKEAGSERIQKYNSMYLFKPADIKYSQLNSSFYLVPDFSTTIKAGETYARMPIHIKTAGLHADSLYALTFGIASVSDPDRVSIRKTDTTLMFTFRLTNSYSGAYQETGRYYKINVTALDTVSLSLTRTFKAVNHNTVRFYHLSNLESISNVAASGVTVKVNDDNSLTVSPWGKLVLNNGGGTYDETAKVFDIWYNYVENGVTYQFKGKFTKSGS